MAEQMKKLSAEFMAGRHTLMAYITGLVRDPHAAEDIFQEVWLKLAEAAERSEEIRHPARWCRGVARNLILHHWRDQRDRRMTVDDTLLERIEQSFAEQDDAAEKWAGWRDALVACTRELPKQSRRILNLKYARGVRVADIAGKLRKTETSVMKFLSRVRQALGQCIRKKLKAAGDPA